MLAHPLIPSGRIPVEIAGDNSAASGVHQREAEFRVCRGIGYLSKCWEAYSGSVVGGCV